MCVFRNGSSRGGQWDMDVGSVELEEGRCADDELPCWGVTKGCVRCWRGSAHEADTRVRYGGWESWRVGGEWLRRRLWRVG